MTRFKMKGVLITMALASLSLSVAAQNKVGTFSIKPMAGLNISSFGSSTYDIYKTRYGVSGGAEIEYGVKPWLGLSLGLAYSQQGAKIDGVISMYGTDEKGHVFASASEMKGKLKCDYLNLPLMANFYIPELKGFALKAGVQVGILTGDKIETQVKTAVQWALPSTGSFLPKDWPQDSFYSYSTSQTDVCKSVDFGIPVGLSYEYRNISLDARYYFGLTKVDKTDDPDNSRNRCLSITFGYRFHL